MPTNPEPVQAQVGETTKIPEPHVQFYLENVHKAAIYALAPLADHTGGQYYAAAWTRIVSMLSKPITVECNCAGIAPTMPVFRDKHLPTCPLFAAQRCIELEQALRDISDYDGGDETIYRSMKAIQSIADKALAKESSR